MAEYQYQSLRQQSILQANSCLIRMHGNYVDDVNWITGKGTPGDQQTVPAEIGHQGNHPTCWAWNGAAEAHVAHVASGHGIPALSIQDTVDHAYPGQRGKDGGNVVAALEWIQTEGVSEEAAYVPYNGQKPPETPPRDPTTIKHRLDAWFLVEDNEESMIEILRLQALVVMLTCYSGVVGLQGEGLVDLVRAEQDHNPDLYPDYCDRKGKPTHHSALLVGYGTFIPADNSIAPINYWIIKNQWGGIWGWNGFAYVIRNSSLAEMHTNRRRTRHAASRLEHFFSPVGAYVNEVGEQTWKFRTLKEA